MCSALADGRFVPIADIYDPDQGSGTNFAGNLFTPFRCSNLESVVCSLSCDSLPVILAGLVLSPLHANQNACND